MTKKNENSEPLVISSSPVRSRIAGTELLMAFAQTKPGAVQDTLQRIVPAGDMQKRVGIEDWAWLHTGDGDGMLDLLRRVDEEVVEDLKLYSQLEADAASKQRYDLCQHYLRVKYTICSRSLLGFFASRNLLPKYGFPVDVVELKDEITSLYLKLRKCNLSATCVLLSRNMLRRGGGCRQAYLDWWGAVQATESRLANLSLRYLSKM